MLPKLKADDTDFEKLLNEYRRMIPGLYEGWTNFNYSDPGVTLLELFVWLKENQAYCLDRITDADKEALLAVLGIKKRHARPASAGIIAEVEKETLLKKGTAFYAGAMCFETCGQRTLEPRNITEIVNSDGERLSIKGPSDFGRISFYPFGRKPEKGSSFYIRLERPLSAQAERGVYIQLENSGEIKRNPLREGFLPVAETSVRIACGEEGCEIKDGTFGLTESGEISVRLSGEMKKTSVFGEEGYYIEIRLESGGYEAAPCISGLGMNRCELVQRETLAFSRDIKLRKGTDGSVRLPEKRFESGIVELYIKKENGAYRKEDAFTRKINENYTEINFDGDCDTSAEPDEAREIRVCALSPAFLEYRTLGEAKGYDRQSFELPLSGAEAESMELMSYDEEADEYRAWTRTESFSKAGSSDRVYVYDEERNELIFGDGINGRMPEGLILLTGFATTKGKGGNIKSGMITQCETADISVVHPKAASSGRDADRTDELFAGFDEEDNTERAVTAGDYERLVRSAPGLMPEAVKILGEDELSETSAPAGKNRIAIVVKPYSERPGGPQINELFDRAYRYNILKYLEDKRMINTELSVFKARDIPIGVYLEAEIRSGFKTGKELIRSTVEEYLFERGKSFGGILKRSEIFSAVSRLKCVEKVLWLNIEAYGNDTEKLPGGDIRIPPDAGVSVGEVRCITRL